MLKQCEDRYGKVTTKCIDNDKEFCHSSTIKSRFGSFSKAKMEADIDSVGQVHLTDDDRRRISEQLTDRQRDIIRGVVMGDGWVNTKNDGDTGRMGVAMVNKPFLGWVRDQIDPIVSDFSLRSSAEDLSEKNRKHGYTVNEENYNDMYILRTHAISFIGDLCSWYDTGQKRFPESIDLTPMALKMWYCCDGSFVQSEYPVIYSANENDRRDVVLSLFDCVPVSPSFNDSGGGAIQIIRDESDTFFEYIGSPPPGFEYKWPDRKI